MNSKDNLQRALKKAFEDHKEPLHEAQWDRLSAVLDKEKPNKKRFLPWFFISFGALLLAVAIGYYMGQHSPSTAMQQNNSPVVTAQSQAATEDTFNINNSSSSKTKTQNLSADETASDNSNTLSTPNTDKTSSNNIDKLVDATTSANSPNTKPNQADKINPNNKKSDKSAAKGTFNWKKPSVSLVSKGEIPKSGNEKKGKTNFDKPKEMTGTANDGAKEQKGETNTKLELADANQPNKENSVNPPIKETEVKTKDPINTPTKQVASAVPTEDTALKTVDPVSLGNSLGEENKDTSSEKKDNKKTNPPGDGENIQPRFAIGFSTGLGTTNFKVNNISNASKVHKDAESLFNQSNANSKTMHLNFNLEWYPLQSAKLGFAAGFQYRSITQNMNINYKYNQIAFRDTTDNILGYIFIPDSSKPVIYHVQGVNKLNYFNIPLRVIYAMPINNKNEILFSGGMNLSFLTKANGESFSVNTAEFSKLSALYKNKVNIGWTLGVQYSYNVYRQWWLGVETQFQQNRYNYFVDYGLIRSRIKITNYNMAVRYKF